MKLQGLFVDAFNVTKKLLKNNSTTVATTIAIAGVVYTAYSTGKAAVKASKKLEKMHYESEKEPTKTEKVKAVAPIFVKPVIVGGATIGLMIWAHSTNLKKQATLLTAYSMAKASKEEFEDKVEEVVGKNKVRKIKDEIAKDTIVNHPVRKYEIIETGQGNELFYDKPGDRYFHSSVQAIQKAEIAINRKLMSGEELYLEVNDLYYEMNLPPIEFAKGLGWCLLEDEAGDVLQIDISTQFAEDDVPCGVIDFDYWYKRG